MRLLLLCIALALVPSVSLAAPNIIIIVSDDQSPNTVSAYGNNILTTTAPTTQIDRIAASGVKFTNSFVSYPLCEPSRAVLYTGKYSHKNGVTYNGPTFDGSQQTIGKLLQAAGTAYQTAIIGKWHLISTPTGFNYFEYPGGADTGAQQGLYWDSHRTICDECGGAGTAGNYTGYFTTNITTSATAWITAHKDDPGPFALFLMHKGPHSAWEPHTDYDTEIYTDSFTQPDTYSGDLSARSLATQANTNTLYPDLFDDWNTWANAAPPNDFGKSVIGGADDAEKKANIYQAYVKDYLRTLKSVDDSVGVILDYLENPANNATDEIGTLAANTIVIYTSDNGMLLGDHGRYNKKEPHEQSMRVPLLMQGPGVPVGETYSQFVLNVDLAPTMLEAAGESIPSDMDGASLLDLIDGSVPADWRTSVYLHTYSTATDPSVIPAYTLRTSRYKLIYHYYTNWTPGTPDWELIDLDSDPTELTNQYANPAYANVVSQLKAEMWRQRALLGIKTSITGGTQSGVTLK